MEWVAVLLVSLFAVFGSIYCLWSMGVAWKNHCSADQSGAQSDRDRTTKRRTLTGLLALGAELGLTATFVLAAGFVTFKTARTHGSVWWKSLQINSQHKTVSGTYYGPNGSRLIVHYADPSKKSSVEFVDSTCQPIGDEELVNVVEQFPRVRDLLLGRTSITNAGLAKLQACRNLESLSLQGLPITARGLQHLVVHHGLLFLDLSGTDISDGDLKILVSFPNLEELRLCDTRISDEGLAHLHQCQHLTSLALTKTNVTTQGISKLQQALPGCKIERKLSPALRTARAYSPDRR